MKVLNEFRLVDGEYDLQELKEIVLTLLDDKIKFHQLKDFSDSERLGKTDDTQSKKRLKDLKNSKENIIAIINDLSNNKEGNKKFKVYSEVKIERV
jgi:cytochrome oxidase Cu insertion factor (SCO1/SenC/PrrC family)